MQPNPATPLLANHLLCPHCQMRIVRQWLWGTQHRLRVCRAVYSSLSYLGPPTTYHLIWSPLKRYFVWVNEWILDSAEVLLILMTNSRQICRQLFYTCFPYSQKKKTLKWVSRTGCCTLVNLCPGFWFLGLLAYKRNSQSAPLPATSPKSQAVKKNQINIKSTLFNLSQWVCLWKRIIFLKKLIVFNAFSKWFSWNRCGISSEEPLCTQTGRRRGV